MMPLHQIVDKATIDMNKSTLSHAMTRWNSLPKLSSQEEFMAFHEALTATEEAPILLKRKVFRGLYAYRGYG